MKSLFKFLGWTLFVLVVLAAVLLFAFGPIAKFAVNHLAGPFLGVSAHVDDVSFSPVKGKLAMENFVLGNPKGFDSGYMMKLDHLLFDLETGSLFSDPLHIEEIEVTGFAVTLDGIVNNNISAFIDGLSGGKDGKEKEEKKEEKPEGKDAEKKPARKVYIGSVDISDTHFNFAPFAGKVLPIPLPPIHLDEIGKPDDGASIMDAVKQIMGGILDAVTGAAKGAGQFFGDAAGAAADAVGSTVGVVGDAAGATVDAVGDALGSTADAVGDAAGAAAGAVGDAAGAA
ncbi:MAG: hypothetical protein IJS32_07740, partial [Kiritimatiellae bacterium]|nr:hypothetical protein [Kiritimatiellia bacterium]